MNHIRQAPNVALTVPLLLVLSGTPASALQCHVGTITFHDGGGLEGCELEGEHELTTAKDAIIVCGSGERATLYPNGALAGCTLAKVYSVDGRSCPAGAVVRLEGDGSISSCE